MIAVLIHILILLVILGLVFWAVKTILGVIPLPEPLKTVIWVILVVIACLIVIALLLPLVGASPHTYW